MTPPPGHPYDLIDQIEMVEEQPLIIHVGMGGETFTIIGTVQRETQAFPPAFLISRVPGMARESFFSRVRLSNQTP